MKNIILGILMTIIVSNSVFSQSIQPEKCGTQLIHNQMILSDPDYKKRYEESQRQTARWININKNKNNQRGTVYTIPVVVHILHRTGVPIGTDENITDAQVQSAIDALNEDFRKKTGTNGDGNGVDCEIEFCLAARDPNAVASTGINRVVASSISGYDTDGIKRSTAGADEVSLKALSKWDNTKYYNIWIVWKIDGGNQGGTQGYAYYPGAPATKDGAVILYNAFGTTGNLKSFTNLNRTTSHELGHGLNLNHTFEGGCANSDCTTDGDKVCDTPPTTENSSCTPASPCGVAAQIENYMDYTSEVCQNMFSQGQSDRMRATLTGTRASLTTSDGCQAAAIPVSNFSASSRIICVGSSVNFSDISINGPTVWTWTLESGTPSSSALKNPSITYNTAGTFDVSLFTSNAIGNGNTEVKTDYISVYDAPASACSVTTTDLVSNFGIGIKNFTLQNINKSTSDAKTDGGYLNFSCSIIDTLKPGNTYNVSVTTGTANKEDVRIYIDFNGDGTLNSTDELVFSSNDSMQFHRGTISIPSSAQKNKVLRMRVKSDYFGNTISSSCSDVENGQAEDYGIVVICNPDPSVTPLSNFSTSGSRFGCAGSTISYSDLSSQCPSSWSWSFPGGTPSSSTVQFPVITYNTPGKYNASLQSTNSNGAGTTETKTNFVSIYDSAVTACAVNTTDLGNGFGMGIKNVIFQNINNASGTAVQDNGYMNFMCSKIDTLRSGSYAVTVTTGTVNNEDVRIYIDFNADGTLNSTDELVFSTNNLLTNHTGTITIPSSAQKDKVLRMRIISDFAGNTISSSCYSPQYGQVEDYGIVVKCISTIPVAIFNANDVSICTNENITFTDLSTGAVNWSWDFGAGASPATASGQGPHTVTYSSNGSKNVSLTILNSCDDADSEIKNGYITVNLIPLTTDITGDAIVCKNESGVSYSVTNTPGSTYSWTVPTGATITSGTGTNAIVVTFGTTSGNVTVIETNSSGCQGSQKILNVDVTDISLTPTTNNISCFGITDGSSNVSVSGGSLPLTYSWNTTPAQNTSNATGLNDGNYEVTVSDANGCTATSGVTVSEPTPLTLAMSGSDPSCNGGNNGSATATVSGGTSGYNYSWSTSPVQITSTATGLSATSYTVTVTDSKSCTITNSVTLTQPSVITATMTFTAPSCNGGTNGTATVTASGGTASYTYSWSTTPALTASTATGLTAITYTVTVTDIQSCTKTNSVTLTQPSAITATMTFTAPGCNGGSNGTTTASVAGGTSSYTYSWSTTPAQTTSSVTGLSATGYTVTVTDSKSCTKTNSVTVSQPPAIVLSTSSNTATCGNSDGSADVSVTSGGTGPFTYSWSTTPAQTTSDATGLSSGSYSVTVSDSKSCTSSGSASVSDASAPAISSITGTNPSCNNGTNGSATVSASGGTGGLTYLWSTTPAQTTSTVTSLSASVLYSVTVTDAVNCKANGSITLNNPTLITATMSSTSPSCNGGTNGSATVTATGGTAGYSYSWNTAPAQPTSTTTGLSAITYTVTVTDSKSCTKTNSVTLTQPTLMSLTMSFTSPSCNGGTNGTATANVAGGSSGFTYSWTTAPAQTTSNGTGLSAITYTITVTDSKSCTRTNSVTLTQPTAITATMSFTDPSCNGGSNGTATVTATGGTAGYTYLWNTAPAATVSAVTGLISTSYTVTVTDSKSCTKTNSVTVSQPSAIVLSTSSNTATCGNADGSGTVSVTSGGTGPFTYSWSTSPVQTTSNVTGLTSGTYSITVSDSKTCTSSANVSISDAAAPTISSVTGTSPNCNNGSNGTATVSASGGTGSLTYSWSTSPSQTTSTITGLSASVLYSVTVTDAVNCKANGSVTLTNPSVITATMSSSNPSCNGGSNGNATVTASGGTVGYTYLWSTVPAQTTSSATGLSATTYIVTVTDSKSCTSTNSVTITEPTLMTVTMSFTNPSCNGGTNGTATASVAGGTAGYTYSWTTAPAQTSSVGTGFSAITYTVTVTDAKSCTKSNNVTLSQPSAITASMSSTDPSCNTGTNGKATVTISGGTARYTYSWSTIPAQTTSAVTGLSATSYTVTVIDSKSCIRTNSVTISQPTAITATMSFTAPSCNGETNGTATTNVAGGTSGYTYSWTTAPAQTGSSITGLSDGIYTVTVTDSKSCTRTNSVTVTEPTPMTVTMSFTSPACNGGTNGTATTTSSGGTAGYNYLWSTIPAQTTSVVTGLLATTYTVTVTDTKSCLKTNSVTLSQPSAIVLSTTTNSATCGNSDGSSTVSVTSGGISPFTYSWSTTPAQTTSNATGLSSGSYSVTVTDSKTCTSSTNVSISDAAAPTISSVTGTNPSCNNGSNGTATVSASGGTGALTYSWSTAPAQTSSMVTGLSASVLYSVTVTDAVNCKANGSITLTNPNQITATMSSSNPSCNGGSNGKATVTASGGTAGYTYSWSTTPAQTTSSVTGLSATTYTVTVTDSKSCTRTNSVNVTQPSAITATISFTAPSCNGGTNGTATVTASGGTSGFTYLWSSTPAQNASTATGLSATTYTVSVTDTKSCTQTNTVTITQPSAMTATMSFTEPGCNGATNGKATVTASGGTSGYTYLWSTAPAQTTSTATGLVALTYTVTVTDSKTCTQTNRITLSQPSAITLSMSSTDPSCNNGTNGTSTVTVSGGTAGYTYLWSTLPVQTTSSVTGLSATSHNVTVTDSKSCTQTNTVTLSQPSAITATMSSTNPECFGGTNGSSTVTVSGGTAGYTYSWSTAPTQSTSAVTGLSATSYAVTVTDSKTCTASNNVTLIDPASMVVSSSSTDATCGNMDGSASVNITSGGSSPFTYSWSTSPAQTSSSATGISSGSYNVTITDNKGCTISTVASVNDFAAATITSILGTNPLCNGNSNGTATVSASGGTGGLNYLWNTTPAQTTSIATGLKAGILYNVSVTDAVNCKANGNITLTDPSIITATISSTDPACNGGTNGSSTVTATGGTVGYTYSWSTVPIQTTSVATGLSASSYTVTVTDGNNCTVSQSITINQPTVISITFIVTDVKCFGGNDGKIDLIVNGGIPPYTYQWNGNYIGTTQDVNNAISGGYGVTVTDDNNCTTSRSITIGGPSQSLTLLNSVTDVKCHGEASGSVLLQASGGTQPPSPTFLWSNGITTKNLSNVIAGIYIVTVTDINGCTATNQAIISEPDSIVLSAVVTDVKCNGASTGAVNLTVNGGISSYFYSWSNGVITEDINGVVSGTYILTVTDQNLCTAILSSDVNEPTEINIVTSSTPASCPSSCNDGTATAVVNGGVQPYTFSWNTNPSQIDSVATSLISGTYQIIVTDKNGCIDSNSVVVDFTSGKNKVIALSKEVNIYPNPFSDKLFVNFDFSENKDVVVEIQNIEGKVIINKTLSNIKKQNQLFDLSSESDGIYIIKVKTKEKEIIEKIILSK